MDFQARGPGFDTSLCLWFDVREVIRSMEPSQIKLGGEPAVTCLRARSALRTGLWLCPQEFQLDCSSQVLASRGTNVDFDFGF